MGSSTEEETDKNLKHYVHRAAQIVGSSMMADEETVME